MRRADVCLLLEGTYPYVSGGVSSWVHEIVRSMPELRFALVHIGAAARLCCERRFELPDNVTSLHDHYCAVADDVQRAVLERSIRMARRRHTARPSRTLAALRRLHLESVVDDDLLEDLAVSDLDIEALLHGDEAFDVITEIGRLRAPDAPFLAFFWHFRSMHVPLLRLLNAPLPEADVYHSVCTGYSGVVAAVASIRTGRPMLLTEHGIYTREREMELAGATWIDATKQRVDPRVPLPPSPLRRMWSTFFRRLAQIAYHRARHVITLSECNRAKQIEDGAPAPRTAIIANGVDLEALAQPTCGTGSTRAGPPRVGFVGRLVPIKDVITFIKACHLALQDLALDIEIIGPTDEDPAYANRCRALIAMLDRDREIRIVGPRPVREIYVNLDLCVLTSFSEGQPLVILEAHAAGVPVIATDVGACQEMLRGRDAADRALGPSGIVTRVAAPEETAAALVELGGNEALRRQMGQAGRARVHARYGKAQMIESYRTLYATTAEAH